MPQPNYKTSDGVAKLDEEELATLIWLTAENSWAMRIIKEKMKHYLRGFLGQ